MPIAPFAELHDEGPVHKIMSAKDAAVSETGLGGAARIGGRVLSNFRNIPPLASAPAPEHSKAAPMAHASSEPQAEPTIIIDPHKPPTGSKPEEAIEPDSEPKTRIEPKVCSAEKPSTPTSKGEPGGDDSVSTGTSSISLTRRRRQGEHANCALCRAPWGRGTRPQDLGSQGRCRQRDQRARRLGEGRGRTVPFDFRSTPPTHPCPAPVHNEALAAPAGPTSSAPQAPRVDLVALAPASAHVALDSIKVSDSHTLGVAKAEDGGNHGATSTAAGGHGAAATTGQRVHEAVSATGATLGDVITATGVEVAELSKAGGAKLGELKHLYCDLGDRIEAAGVRAEAAVAAGAAGLREAVMGVPVPAGGAKPAPSS